MFRVGDWVKVTEPNTYFTGRVGKIVAIDKSDVFELTAIDILLDDCEVTLDETQIALFEKGPVELKGVKETGDDF